MNGVDLSRVHLRALHSFQPQELHVAKAHRQVASLSNESSPSTSRVQEKGELFSIFSFLSWKDSNGLGSGFGFLLVSSQHRLLHLHAMEINHLLILAIIASSLFSIMAGKVDSLESVPDLEKAMYLTIDGYPCVRLLNLSGEIGCANPGRGKVVAPIVRFKNADEKLARSSAVLVSLDEMKNFFLRVSKDLNFAQKVAGVLVESKAVVQNDLPGFSPVEKFPQAEFAPYQKPSYEWNPAGSGIMWDRYNFPVFLLSKNSTLIIQEIASKNEKSNKAYPVDVAEFDLVMQTTKIGTHDSETCLKEQSCLPLGGYSVWSSLPPINVSSLKPPKPIILVVTSLDSASFFRDKSLGADSPLSGMISLLAAVDALSHIDGVNELRKQLVFVVFTGEAWGYLGSRRFLAELDMGSDVVSGLNITLIEQVLEIGSVGKGSREGATNFFAHVVGESSGAKEMLNALQGACDSLGSERIKIKVANNSNPGIPPSSLMTFIRKNLSASGVVLEEFNSAFMNNFYHSHLDDSSNVNSTSIVAAASLVARTLLVLAAGDSQSSTPVLNSIKINVSLVEELVGCLLNCEPGLSCGLVKDFITPSSICPNHYVGVFLGPPSALLYPAYVDDTSRFVWNFLADRTSIPTDNSSSCTGECSNPGEVCIRPERDGKGICVISTTRYVPAYSTRLKFEAESWHVLPANASDPMGMVDPIWTESFWDTISLRVYTVQSSAYDRFILLGGVAVTIAAYIAIIAARAFFTKALKHD
ncbi:nicastrin isoform X2 [Magnolia sinica]|uniref:nicastrin isoform X2 n=1 Tax=Magnolia sinica TaxID=86752 RepID=UPI0026598B73|nr:nicastrin isoform X2 [Magnolia sinica]